MVFYIDLEVLFGHASFLDLCSYFVGFMFESLLVEVTLLLDKK